MLHPRLRGRSARAHRRSRRCASSSSPISSPQLARDRRRSRPHEHQHACREPTADSHRFDVRRSARDFPILSELGARQAAGLSRQREHEPEAAGGDQGDGRLLPAREREHPSRHASAERAGHRRCTRARARKPQRSSTPPIRTTIVLTKGTTDGINLVAQSYGRSVLKAGDEILISWLEHHSNIVPWQLVCRADRRGARVVPINELGEIDLDAYARAAVAAHADRRHRPRLERARHDQSDRGDDRAGARAPAPWCWSTARRRRRISPSTCRRSTATSTCCRATRCSARPASACSTARASLLEAMPPYQGGGDMIAVGHVREDALQRSSRTSSRRARRTSPASPASARRSTTCRRSIARPRSRTRTTLLAYATARVREIPGARIIGEARHKTGVLSFLIEGVHPHDAGTILDQRGHRRPHRPALRAAGDGPLRHPGHDSRLARRSTTRARTSTRWCAALHNGARGVRADVRI